MAFPIKFNRLLKDHLSAWEAKETLPALVKDTPQKQESTPEDATFRRTEKVVGGVILWKPVDRQAAKMLAKSPWWAKPPQAASIPVCSQTPVRNKPKKRNHNMHGVIKESGFGVRADEEPVPKNGSYVSQVGLKVHMKNGEAFFEIDEVNALLVRQIESLPKLSNPNVVAAQDARKIIDELLRGIGTDMEKFKSETKIHLDDIRNTRFAMVTESSHIVSSLREVRQFFMGPDYKDEISRLKEFVDLCERMQKLKSSGFLDQIADTMLRLSP